MYQTHITKPLFIVQKETHPVCVLRMIIAPLGGRVYAQDKPVDQLDPLKSPTLKFSSAALAGMS